MKLRFKSFCYALPVMILLFCTTKSYGNWAKTYGGTRYEFFYSVQQTNDNGYIVAGTTNSFGAGLQEIWLLKLDSSGIVQWQKTYNGTSYAIAFSVQQTSDGGYIVAGGFYSFVEHHYDNWLLKLDTSGTVEWQKTYGGTSDEYARSVQQTSDNGYILAGGHRLLKLDSSGSVQWQKTYGGTQFDTQFEFFYSVQQTSDGGYIVLVYDSTLLKLDSSGVVQWQKKYRYGDDLIKSVQQTSDNGYILAGTIMFDHYEWAELYLPGGSDGWLLKLDSSGVVQWQKRFNGSTFESFHSVQQTSDNGYIAAGDARSYETGSYDADSWLVKLDSSGVVQWQKKYGGIDDESATLVQQTSDGGYIVAGTTETVGASDVDGWLLKLDSSGNIPGCNIIGISDAIVTDTTIVGENTSITPIDSSATVTDTSVSPKDISCTVDTVCSEDTGPCPSSVIYGEHSEQTEVLRHFRDNVLSQTPEGQELIKLYYQWSPFIVRTMETDEDFRQEIKELLDEVLQILSQ